MGRWRARTRALAGVLLTVGAWGTGGCQDIDWGQEQAWWNPNARRVRPHGASARRVEPRTPPPPSPRPPVPAGSAPPAPAPRVTQAPAAPAPAAGANPVAASDPGVVYRLELFSGPGELRREPNVQRTRLNHQQAERTAALVEILLPGTGRGGTEDDHTLLYQSEPAWRLAVQFATLLDVATVDATPATTPPDANAAFRLGIGMVYSLLAPGRPAADRVARAEALLSSVAQSGHAKRPLRWASAMVAGKLLSAGRFERFDFDGARQHFLIAQRHSEPASFPHMIALHARAYTFEQQGQPAKARELFVRIKEEYLPLHATSIYQQVRRQVAEPPAR